MKNSTCLEITSVPSSDYRDFDFIKDIQKKSKISSRFITCTICGKSITKASMVNHQISHHSIQKLTVK